MIYLLVLFGIGQINQAVAKDPFQSFDLSQCTSFLSQLSEWKLKAVLTNVSRSEAILSHDSLGIRKVTLGIRLPLIHGHVTQIELTSVEIGVLPPCSDKRIRLYMQGAS